VDVAVIADGIGTALRARSTPGRAAQEKAYLKSELEHYGVSVPALRSVAKSVAAQHAELSHDDLFLLVGSLWGTRAHEPRMVAVELLEIFHDRLEAGDLERLERLLRESRTWALVDPLAVLVLGRLLEDHAELRVVVDRWASDGDFWVRRAALLVFLAALRRGEGDFASFSRYADAMLGDKEPFVRKAIGWVLRETGRKRPDMVYEWLGQRAARASGVTVKEAVKPLSEQQRATVLAARRGAIGSSGTRCL
jgi:3-methyladenine DNA glycosylase AlkD